MDKEPLYLIYVNVLGNDWKEETLYEFIFSNNIKDIDGEDWDLYPAAGQPSPPRIDFIKSVGVLTTNLKLDTVQNSDTFCVWDAVDGVIALAWEDVSVLDEYPDHRLKFKFGEPIKSVEDMLYERDFVLDYKLKENGKHKKDNQTIE